MAATAILRAFTNVVRAGCGQVDSWSRMQITIVRWDAVHAVLMDDRRADPPRGRVRLYGQEGLVHEFGLGCAYSSYVPQTIPSGLLIAFTDQTALQLQTANSRYPVDIADIPEYLGIDFVARKIQRYGTTVTGM